MSFLATQKTVKSLLSNRKAFLDFGCGDGALLQELAGSVNEAIGVDLDARLVETANRSNTFSNVSYLQADANNGLPFNSNRFDVIVALGVLEHVGPEERCMREFDRLLRPDGHLVIEVPSLGPFRALDIGNVKYNFPRLHRWFYYYIARQPRYYQERFGPGATMFGQFSKAAKEHRHYSKAHLTAVAAPWFSLERSYCYGLFFELIQFTEVLVSKPLGHNSSRFLSWLLEQDCKLLSPIGRAAIVAVFRKKSLNNNHPNGLRLRRRDDM